MWRKIERGELVIVNGKAIRPLLHTDSESKYIDDHRIESRDLRGRGSGLLAGILL